MKPGNAMDWIVLVIILLVLGGFLFLRLGGTVSADEARRYLRGKARCWWTCGLRRSSLEAACLER